MKKTKEEVEGKKKTNRKKKKTLRTQTDTRSRLSRQKTTPTSNNQKKHQTWKEHTNQPTNRHWTSINITTMKKHHGLYIATRKSTSYVSKCLRPLFSKMNLPTSAYKSDPSFKDCGEAKEAYGGGSIMWMERTSVCHRKGIVGFLSPSCLTYPGSQVGWHIPL